MVSIEGDRTVEMLLETEFNEQVPALSPDGRWIAYQSNKSGQPEIFVQPFPDIDDGEWQVSLSGGFDPIWSPDGGQLFFTEFPPGRLMVSEVETDPTFRPGTPTEAFSLSGFATGRGDGRRYDPAPDGDRFIIRTVGAQTAEENAFQGLILVENWFEELKQRVPVP